MCSQGHLRHEKPLIWFFYCEVQETTGIPQSGTMNDYGVMFQRGNTGDTCIPGTLGISIYSSTPAFPQHPWCIDIIWTPVEY